MPEIDRAAPGPGHATRNYVHSALPRPVLESHLFGPSRRVRNEPPRTPDALRATVVETAEHRRSAAGEARVVAGQHGTDVVSGAGERAGRRPAALRDDGAVRLGTYHQPIISGELLRQFR